MSDNAGLTPNAPSGGAPDRGDLPDPEGKRNSYQNRIHTLTLQREEAKKAAEAERARSQELEQRLSSLEQRISQAPAQPNGQGEPLTWETADADTLQRMMALEMGKYGTDEEGNPITPDPNVVAKIMAQIAEKKATSHVSEAESRRKEDAEIAAKVQNWRTRAVTEYPDCFQSGSDLQQRAMEIVAELGGGEALNRMLRTQPDAEYRIVQAAAGSLAREGRFVGSDVAQELEVLRRRAGVESAGGPAIAEAETRHSRFLKEGNQQGALKDLAERFLSGQP